MASDTNAQDHDLLLSSNNLTIEELIANIESQTDYLVVYNPNEIELDRSFAIHTKSKKITDILFDAFNETNINYSLYNQYIVLKKGENKTKSTSEEKRKKLSGIILDENKEPIIGASVIITGTTTGTITNTEGYFELDIPLQNEKIDVSYIGYVKRTINIKNENNITVVLEEDNKVLDEVVVVGYGVQRKAVMTGSVSTISQSEIKNSSSSNISNALAGKMPGLIALNESGEPGKGSKLLIRGMGTWNNSNPLVIVDGVERSMDTLDPNEIEAISILKDAAAAAVYGARAANGVILITTQRGKVGRPIISVDSYYGFKKPTRYPDLANSFEYATMKNRALQMDGVRENDPRYFTPEQLELYKSGEIDTDWFGETFDKKAAQYYINTRLSGGNEKIKYFVSLGHRNEDYIIPDNDYKQFNFRTNLDIQATKQLNLSVDVDMGKSTNRTSGYTPQYLFQLTALMQPQMPSYHKDGLPYNVNGNHSVEMVRNSGFEKNTSNNARATFKANYSIPWVEGLNIKGMYSYGQSYSFVKKFFLPYTLYDENSEGEITNERIIGEKTSLSERFNQNKNYLYNVQLDYNNTFDKHEIGALFLYEQEERNLDNFNAFRTNFITNAIPELFAGGDEDKDNNGSASEWARNGLIGRFNYAYDSKYMLEASFRYDGSITFPKGSRYGFFPSYSLAWRISEENFIKDKHHWIDNLKLRVSYGTLGNDQVSLWQYMSEFTITSKATIGGSNQNSISIYNDLFPNPNITWEKSSTLDIGLEGTLWNGLLNFEIDFFNKRTKDILSPKLRTIPGTFGAKLPDENYGILRNRGIEIMLSHFNTIGKDLSYNIGMNFSFTRNKVIDFDESESTPEYYKVVGRPFTYTSGRRPYAGLVGMKAIGFFESQEDINNWPKQFNGGQKPGDIKYADVNGDGVINENDLIVVSRFGNIPEIVYGINFGIKWKDLQLTGLLQGVANKSIMLSGIGRTMFRQGNNNFFKYLSDDAWTPDKTNAKYPRPYVGENNNNNRNSAIWQKNGNYLRLKNIELSYTIPKQIINRLDFFDNVRIYLAGTNLLTFDKLKVMDPETSSASAQYYPQQKSINFGINLTY